MLEQKLKAIPNQPGVYLMKDADGTVIYVGKAIALRNRVRSYFHKSDQGVSPKVRILAEQIADIEYIVTANEVEALILESNLIKEKSPKYNVRLKDDKHYPYLKVTGEKFPRVIVVRRREAGGRTFGPYTDATAVRTTMDFLRKLFPLRTCTLDLSGELNYRPCLLYHIGRCGAPCAGLQSEKDYGALIDEVTLFLEGRHDRLIPGLRTKMKQAASELEFERAARYRDQMHALERMVERQKIIADDNEDQDVIGLARKDGSVCVQVFFVRNGKLVGRDHFFLDTTAAEESAELLTAFVDQYYEKATFIPRTVLLPEALLTADMTERWLSERRGARVYLHVPQRGEKKRLVEMAEENARLVLEEHLARADRRLQANLAGLAELQRLLGLTDIPQRIEAFDISNLQGQEAVGSMVVLEEGEPTPADYRRFKIRTVDGSNDVAMMHEVVRRRFTRGLKEQEELAAVEESKRDEALSQLRFVRFPDLIVIDGGPTQLQAARDALRDLDLEHLPMVSLAERLEQVYTEDDPEPLVLPEGSPALLTLQRVRDEAHRFALNYHRRLRDRKTTRSRLDDIQGIGPKRKKALLQKFGSVRGIKEASLEQLQAVPGISRELAERLHNELL